MTLTPAQQALIPEKAAEPSAKRVFYSVIPVCSIQVMRSPGYCTTERFVGGMMETDDPAIISYLDAIVDKPGSGITTKNAREVEAQISAAQEDARLAAEKAHGRMVASGLSTA